VCTADSWSPFLSQLQPHRCPLGPRWHGTGAGMAWRWAAHGMALGRAGMALGRAGMALGRAWHGTGPCMAWHWAAPVPTGPRCYTAAVFVSCVF
jgi:hypothetical protein